MTISFPSNPVVNQIYVYEGKTYTYTGKRWRQFTTAPITSAAISMKDEGATVNEYVKSINFVGPAVTAVSDVLGNVTVTISTSGNTGATGASGPIGATGLPGNNGINGLNANVNTIIGLTMVFGG